MLWLFYIWATIQTGLFNAGLIRNIFNEAVSCTKASKHAGIWFYYIMWEISEKEYLNAKALVFRGVRECPWAKDLYLFVGVELGSMFNEVELDGMGRVMEGCEIRMRSAYPGVDE
jgi:hypothetical protein